MAWKDACRVATTQNITLSGTQTIDGVALGVGDRVLVKDQTTASANGIYTVAAGAWARATDADASSEIPGMVAVTGSEGIRNGSRIWLLQNSGAITLGTTALAFQLQLGTYKDACRVGTTQSITLSGTQTIDGVALSAGDRVLVKDQSPGATNGIYTVATGTWTRAADANSALLLSKMSVRVQQGTTQALTDWSLITADPFVLGTTALAYVRPPGAGAASSIADLQKRTGSTQGALATVEGYYAPGDGGGGDFWFDSNLLSFAAVLTASHPATPICITTVTPHCLTNGSRVMIAGVQGNTAANGTWMVALPSTTIAAGSSGQSLPQATINVASTSSFPASGIIAVTTAAGVQSVSYAGKSATQFTGCTGGTGAMSTGGAVTVPTTSVTQLSSGQALPQATINVVSTAGFPSAGTLSIRSSALSVVSVTYTGTTATSFTGCTGGSGSLHNGGIVASSSVTTFTIVGSSSNASFINGGLIGDGGLTIPSAVAIGVWRRLFSGPVNVLWFGAQLTTGTFDSQPAIMAALDASPDVFLPGSPDQSSWYYCVSPITISGIKRSLTGAETGGVWQSNTVLKFPAGVDGIKILVGTQGGCKIQNLTLNGSLAGTTYCQGITITVQADLRNVEVQNFLGCGIEIYGAGGSSNCNSCYFDHVRSVGNGRLQDASHPSGSDGFYVHGLDSNACVFNSCRGSTSGRYNIHDESFLGNVWIGPECDSAGQSILPGELATTYYIGGSVSNGLLVNPYAEGQRVFLGPRALVVGGNVSPGMMVPGSQGHILSSTNSTNMAFHNVSADDPTILRLAVTLTPMDNTDAICEWFTPGAPDSTYQWRLYPGSQYAADIYKSAWYWTKQQAGMPLEVAIGITAPDFYRGAGKCIIPNAYYLGASATSAKRHWQAQDRGAAERLALEIGDSYLFTTPTAGGFMGEVVTRAGVWARVWAPNMSYTTGDLVSPTVDNGHYYEIGLPNDGQSGPTEPTWPTTPGGSITVDGVTYVEHGVSALFKTYGAISA